MKTELKAKFLQHLAQKRKEEGFTLIELLVVIIIIGILSAIALPNFLNQSAKAKQSEAKQNVAVVNRTQTAYRTENQGFATSFDQLGIGVLAGGANATTTNYSYTLAASTDTASIVAQSRDTSLKGYTGGNNRYTVTSTSESVIASVICEVNTPGTTSPTAPQNPASSGPTCQTGQKTLTN
jgi:type IV pilus assembly protein PilA